MKEYRDKAVEVVGVKKEQAIRDAVAKDKLEKANVKEREFISTGRGETPCFDPLTNTCFGETMGWDIDKGYIELDFSSQLVDGVPYLVLGHRVPPVYLGW